MTLQKNPQLLCVKLEDPKFFTSQALRRSRAVIHLEISVVKSSGRGEKTFELAKARR